MLREKGPGERPRDIIGFREAKGLESRLICRLQVCMSVGMDACELIRLRTKKKSESDEGEDEL